MSIGNNWLQKQEPKFNEAISQASPFLKEEPKVVFSLSNTYAVYVNEKGSLAQKIQQLECCLLR